MRVADAGAGGGAESCWDVYGNQLHLIGFEPDAEECKRLNRLAKKNTPAKRKEEYYPIALYRDKGVYTLHISQNKVASSLFPINQDFVSRFPHDSPGAIVGSAQIKTTDIDSFLKENEIGHLDFMKVDVEGAELALFEGAKNLLSESLLGLSVEVFFHPYHTGRPLFGDIDRYLRQFGFILFDLQPEKWVRKTLATKDSKGWYGAGQLIWAQALYFLDLPARMAAPGYIPVEADRLRVLKLSSLAEVFGFPDFAIEVLQAGRNKGLLRDKETGRMVNLVSVLEGNGAHFKYTSLVKAVARKLLPLVVRRRLKIWLKRFLMEVI
ncbi:MAG: FkbM family methyltransferase [Candidatus Ratteibacteria bacterium]